jgi:hypothetical protein
MKTLVRPELPTAAVRSSQATLAAVDNSAPLAIRPESTYKSGKVVQTTGATSADSATVMPFTAARFRIANVKPYKKGEAERSAELCDSFECQTTKHVNALHRQPKHTVPNMRDERRQEFP